MRSKVTAERLYSGLSRRAGSRSARRSQQPGLGRQRLVLLDVVLLEAHGDPLGHLQVLLQTQLGAAGLRGQER